MTLPADLLLFLTVAASFDSPAGEYAESRRGGRPHRLPPGRRASTIPTVARNPGRRPFAARSGASAEKRASSSSPRLGQPRPGAADSLGDYCPMSLLLDAARRRPTPRPPIWLMRQAGRYLPEYRRLRQKTSFLELCKNSALAAEVMIKTVERLGVDAAIIFADLLLILEPMGLSLRFDAGEGPVLAPPIADPTQLDRLRELDDLGPLEYVCETVRRTRAGLGDDIPVIGFAGAPFTMAAYAIEGGASRDFQRAKRWMLQSPDSWDELLGRIARATVRYLNAQIDAGAQVVQLFDSWVGCLSPADYRRSVLPHSRAVIENLRPGVPVIHFATGNPALVPLLAEAGGARRNELVVGVDWRIVLDEAWRAAGDDVAIQGNLDPAVLLTSPEIVRREAQAVLRAAGGRPGHIFNLGHGVLPQTPVENVLALIDTVKRHAQ